MSASKAKVADRIQKLITEAESLAPGQVAAWVERARLAVIAGYGENSGMLKRFDDISYSPGIWTDSTPSTFFDEVELDGRDQAVGMLVAMNEDLDEALPLSAGENATHKLDPTVFVVHGHDSQLREATARLLERLELEAVILMEQPDQGRTIIEKFEESAGRAGFAVVLLAPDDFGRNADEVGWPESPNRARQNVILELGYFMGLLGRKRTAAIYSRGTDLPSDIHGLLYIPADENWQLRLAKELKSAGLPVDLNKLMD